MRAAPPSLEAAWSQVRAARGTEPIDLLVRDCRIVNVYSGEIHGGDIAVRDGLIVAIREGYRGAAALTIDGAGRLAVPGLVTSFGRPERPVPPQPEDARAGLCLGITSVVADTTAGDLPAGPELAARQWTAARFAAAGPAAPGPACAGDGPAALAQLRAGFPGFLAPADGNAGPILAALRRAGADVTRVCLGRLAPGESVLVAAQTALRVMGEASGIGLAPAEACALATLNPAIAFGLDHRVGSISPGRCADFFLAESLGSVPTDVVLDGRLA